MIVYLTENPLDAGRYEQHDVEDVRAFLASRYPAFPQTARIYHEQVAQDRDVTPPGTRHADGTPTAEHLAAVRRLGELPGPFFVIVYPADPVSVTMVAVAIAASAAMAFLLKPRVPAPALRSASPTSPNNGLSDRQNQARPRARIPDIFGTVRSTFDLLGAPYRVYEAHREIEHALMAIGRGSYDVTDVRDGATPVGDIEGASVEVYAPGSSPLAGAPQLAIGPRITAPLQAAVRSGAVNGQVLRPPNAPTTAPPWTSVHALAPNVLEFVGAGLDLTGTYQAGDVISVTGSSFAVGDPTPDSVTVPDTALGPVVLPHAALLPSSIVVTDDNGSTVDWTFTAPATVTLNSVSATGGTVTIAYQYVTDIRSLDGTYTVQSVTEWRIYLRDAAAVAPDWLTVAALNGASGPGSSPPISPTIAVTGERWIGPFVLDARDVSEVLCNFVAPSGLYRDDGTTQGAENVAVTVEVTPLDADGNPAGAAVATSGLALGSPSMRGFRALSLRVPIGATGPCSVRARRTSDHDFGFTGAIADELQWRDLYAMTTLTPTQAAAFGDVTIVRAATLATTSALAVRERKLNALVTRRIRLRDGSIGASRNAADILCAVALDPRIGNRQSEELDFDSIYGAIGPGGEVESYFGTPLAAEFSYTFDKDNISFEETVAMIAATVFCTAYRRGSQIKLAFEKATPDSVLLFNHRNVIAGSESRTFTFGDPDGYDGVELEYVDPSDDSVQTFYLPADRSALNPRKIETVGIRSKLQAHLHAWRAYNRQRFQALAVELEGMQEAEILVLGHRILVADSTQAGTLDAQVEDQVGLVLRLSAPVTLAAGVAYSIHLQHQDGTTEAIGVTQGVDAYHVVLANPPRAALSIGAEMYAKATALIVAATDTKPIAFLVTEKDPQSRMTSIVRGVNYDDRYYENDGDFATGVIDISGNIAGVVDYGGATPGVDLNAEAGD